MADGFAGSLLGTSLRQKPANSAAEEAVLGAILANNRAFEKVADYLTPALFADSVNGRIYQRIAELLLDGRLCDPVSLKNSFENSGILDEVGGTAYLSLLLSRMVSLNTAAEYGLAIRDAWVRRQLIDLGENVVARAFGGEPACDAQKQVELLETALAELRGRAGHSDWVGTVGDTVDAEINAYDARSSGKDGQFLTGWPSLDEALFIAPGSFTLLGGLPGSGKAQPLDEPVLLADGRFVPMGSLVVGDRLASVDGAPSEVVGVFPQGEREVCRVNFSDGRSARVSPDHLWKVSCKIWPKPRILSTRELRLQLSRPSYGRLLIADLASGHFGIEREYVIDPYVLGVLLGDGDFSGNHVRFTSVDEELIDEVKRRLGHTAEVNQQGDSITYSIVSKLKEAGVAAPRKKRAINRALERFGLSGKHSHEKFIPEIYMSGDRQTRLDLLRGLMDTDGTTDLKNGGCSFCSTSKALALGVRNLVLSLGGACRITEKKTTYTYKGEKKVGLLAYNCWVRHDSQEEFFLLSRKRERARRQTANRPRLTFKSVENLDRAQVQCIKVSHPSSLYLTRDYVVTHNTSMSIGMGLERARALHATAIAVGWSPERSKRQAGVAFLSLEMDRQALAQRIIAYEAKVPLRELIRGKLNDIEIERVRQAQGRLRYLPLRIWEGRGMPLRILAPKLRMHLARQPEVCVMVDNLSLTTSDNDGSSNSRFQSDVNEIKHATRGFKQLANELRLPFIVLAHIARPTKNMAVRRPRKEDLAYAGERDADNVVFIHRPEMHLRDKPEQGKYEKDEHYSSVTLLRWENECARAKDVAEIVVAKQRQGEERVVRLKWTGATTSLSEFDTAASAPIQEPMPDWVTS